MDFIDRVQAHAKNIPQMLDKISSEEGTKTALVLPFIQILGYNIFDPQEVNPELTADARTKKEERVDYAIMKNGVPILLFECKPATADLNKEHAAQLYRYFSVTPALIGILTNGIIYRFFTDLEEPNKMDQKPFLEINLLDIKEPLLLELKKFTKQDFKAENLEIFAADLKYTREIKQVLTNEMLSPSEELVRFFATKVEFKKKFTQQTKDKFSIIAKNALNQFINDKINERLKSAMAKESAEKEANLKVEEQITEEQVVTTQAEVDAFNIIRAIITEIADPSRVYMRDAKSYCAILFDDNKFKPIARLRFGTKQLAVGVFDNDRREEEKIPITNINELFKLGSHFKNSASKYMEIK